MNNETKISSCPYCDSECVEGETFTLEGGGQLTEVDCMNCTYMAPSIESHNAHCALIEKGRVADEQMKRFVTDQVLLTDTIAHLDTAIRLLGKFGEALEQDDMGDLLDSIIDIAVSDLHKYLADPTIEKILKAQKDNK